MKAIVYTKYGPPDVLQYKEVEKPVPGDKQVLVKLRAAALNAADWHLLRADPFIARMFSGLFKPKHTILGADIAGVAEAAGKDVKEFKPGDAVFGDMFSSGLGGLAEYVCANEDALALKPANISFEEAASVPVAGGTALQGLRDAGQIQPGKKVLINGASGGVGTFAVQIAKALGAEVTAVCSTKNTEMARSLGADHVIDYRKEDFTKNGLQYDLILAANGYHPLADYKRSLSPTGIYVMAGGAGRQMFEALAMGPFLSEKDGKKLGGLSAKVTKKDLIFLKELIEAGKVKPVIDRRFPLSEAVQAFKYLEEGHARGKVVITVL
jgi:NADPH:quinone reductase-like Zn-dependent oxidoreductase